MATSTASDLAGGGAGTHLGSRWFYSTTRTAPVGPLFVYWKSYRQGSTGETFPYFDTIAASSYSEGGSAATPTVFPTISGTTVVPPAGYRASTGSTSEGQDRVIPDNDLEGEERALLIYAHQSGVSSLASVGLGAFFNSGSITNSVGTSGDDAVYDLIPDSHNTVAATAGGDVHTVTIINNWQFGHINQNLGAKTAQAFNKDGAGNWVENIFRRNPFLSSHYVGSTSGGRNHVFVEAKDSYLATDSGDYVACTFVPDYRMLRAMASVLDVPAPESDVQVIPGFVGVAKENPVSRKGGRGRPDPELVPLFPGTPVVGGIVPRVDDGINAGNLDAWAYWAIALGKAGHACKIISTAS